MYGSNCMARSTRTVHLRDCAMMDRHGGDNIGRCRIRACVSGVKTLGLTSLVEPGNDVVHAMCLVESEVTQTPLSGENSGSSRCGWVQRQQHCYVVSFLEALFLSIYVVTWGCYHLWLLLFAAVVLLVAFFLHL